MNDLSVFLSQYESYLVDFLDKTPIPAERLKEAIRYSLFPGGKRLRPALIYLVGKLLDLPLTCINPMAAAIELIHTYSLIHDDLPAMDNDDLRRGKPSCHKAFDEATAILAGDGLQALALSLLIEELTPVLPAQSILSVAQHLLQACGTAGMVSGQALDLTELTQTGMDAERLTDIHHLKTGQLILACINMPLAATETTSLQKAALISYAQHIGLAFQMQDDYLDAYAPSILGKGRRSDAINDKTTFASLFAESHLKKKINACFDSAFHALNELAIDNNALAAFTQTIVERTA